jgi:phenylacetate-coenzyme A ligase PaaK-like adenylate-forming protein
MPFIRHETGDMAQFAGHVCLCGLTLPLLAAVHGRAHDSSGRSSTNSSTPSRM